MEGLNPQVLVPLDEPSRVGEARRAAVGLALTAGLDEVDCGRAALVVTELATNVLKHARGGHLILQASPHEDAAVEALALDTGAGMFDVEACLADGYSSAGSAGAGLGAVCRAATTAIHSTPGRGTVVHARVGRGPAPTPDVAAVSLPVASEAVCGDAWTVVRSPGRTAVLLADGLGHGPGAREAARAAVDAFALWVDLGPAAALGRLHEAVRGTRGCAAAIASIDHGAGVIRFGSVGNVAGAVVTEAGRRNLVCQNGTLGVATPARVREAAEPFPPGALLVLHTDGIASHWDLRGYGSLWTLPAALVAGVLWRDHARARDDASVVVVRAPAGEARQ